MAAAVNRPSPAHSGPNSGNLHSCTDRDVPNFGQQDPRLHDPSQDPGPTSHPQHHIPAQRFLYIPGHAPPPPHPPFLQYQWPMPLSYNPFAGFPGMGYGMVMPPFPPPPPPYLGPPAYILPHPHIQPVDYRRLVHPQVHTGSATYQNQNQTRRIRPVHTVPPRETMNAAVQTESTQRGISSYSDEILSAGSDSGHGTTSNSPYSSSSSSQKRGSPEVENYTLPRDDATDSLENMACANDTGTQIVQSCARATVEPQKRCKDSRVEEDNPLYRNGHCNMRSVRSSDSMVPVCGSSPQVDEAFEKRRDSVSDILMSKMADQMLPQNDCELLAYETECEHERSLYCDPLETKNGPVVLCSADANAHTESVSSSEDNETLFKILKLPFALYERLSESRSENVLMGLDEPLQSLHIPGEVSDNMQETVSETNPDVEPNEIIPYQMSLNISHMKRKMNESVWSVESLAPFTPNEWLQQMFEPEIVNMAGEGETDRLSTQSDNIIVRSSEERMNSSLSDSVPSCLTFSTPAEKQRPPKMPKIESEIEAKDLFVSLSCLQSRLILSPQTEEADENGSSEPEANQSPNQESLIVSVQQEKMSLCPEQEETLILNSMGGQKVSPVGQQIPQKGADLERAADRACKDKEASQLRNDQPCVSMADQRRAQVSPLKGNLVDCGIQCTELKCPCELKRKTGPYRRQPFFEDMRNCGKNQRRNSRLRNRDQEMQSSQQEPNRFYGKHGKSKGGMGRY